MDEYDTSTLHGLLIVQSVIYIFESARLTYNIKPSTIIWDEKDIRLCVPNGKCNEAVFKNMRRTYCFACSLSL